MADDLDALPWGEAGVDEVAFLLQLGFQRLDLGAGVGNVLGELGLEGFDFLFEFDERFFKLQGESNSSW